MSLLDAKPIYKPFRYPWAYDAWLTQQRIHWLPEEVPLALADRSCGLTKRDQKLGPVDPCTECPHASYTHGVVYSGVVASSLAPYNFIY